jgi:hypothetical protein
MNFFAAGLFLASGALAGSLALEPRTQISAKVELLGTPEAIFAPEPEDAWNRIFYFLFSRRIEVRLSNEFPEGAPFADRSLVPNLLPSLRISKRTFARMETGDRAIDPLSPSFLVGTGRRVVLSDPRFSQFEKGLQDALKENVPRSPLARALMQSDLWSAFDNLYIGEYRPPLKEELLQRRTLLDLIARMIREIALTPEEISSLPNNYLAASRRGLLPPLFARDSGWIQVVWFPHRMHDFAADFRRVSRVFVKPAHPPGDVQQFLNSLRNRTNGVETDLDGVALIIQMLLIDSRGDLTPTALTQDVQVRLFEKTSEGVFQRTVAQESEICRRQFLREPNSGGLVHEEERTPAYLPSSGNDLTFASPQHHFKTFPVQVTLRTRCAFCHGSGDLTFLMGFSTINPPAAQAPPVTRLNPAAHERADYVIAQKQQREDFQALSRYFGKLAGD